MEEQVIVAIRAFGLGINKSNVRFVKCYGLPPSVSAWVQELGMEIDSKVESLNYWLAHCNGVKKCEECDHVLPKSYSKNNCKKHPEADLIATEGCPVEFIYVYLQNAKDKKRIGGLIRSSEVAPALNLHNHPIGVESLSHKLPAMVVSDIAKTLDDNPYLTTRQLQCGQGLSTWLS